MADVQEKLQKDIQRYFLQLTKGCGKPNCTNINCASNQTRALTPNEAAATAINLVRTNGTFCRDVTIDSFDLTSLSNLINDCKSQNNYTPLIRRIGSTFSNPESINLSFLKPAFTTNDIDFGVDIPQVRKAFQLLLSLGETSVSNATMNAFEMAMNTVKRTSHTYTNIQGLRLFIIMLEHPLVSDHANHKAVFGPLLYAISILPKPLQDRLTKYWSTFSSTDFHGLLGMVQQYITLRVLLPPFVENLNNDEGVTTATKVMKLLYVVNETLNAVPYTEFNNDLVNEKLDVKEDFLNSLRGQGFSFCNYPFILDPFLKSRILHIESLVSMRQQRVNALQHMMMGRFEVPALALKVRRVNLIEDSLQELSQYEPDDLKKELRIHFVGEEAVDEGGVKKEWFQLIIREIFDAKYGMFVHNSDTRSYWFNGYSTDFLEFELIGKLLGLSIYNSVILDVHFPKILYKKLVGLPSTFEDLKDSHPSLAAGLEKLLQFDGDVENTFYLTFQITEEYLGEKRSVNLKENGDQIPVTNENRHEYVNLYTKYILDEQPRKPLEYFLRGFNMLCNSPGFKMFRAEELELLICGSPVLDFEALEKNTEYDNGYSKDHPAIKMFWSVVHSLTLDQKKRLLFFTTGSDRAPIGGLGNLPFIIARHGGDSDRLPSAHTCFNHLLLPEYNSKDKLQERLLAAIDNAEGFGML